MNATHGFGKSATGTVPAILSLDGLVEGSIQVQSKQPVPPGWVRIPADVIDVIAPKPVGPVSWSPTSIIMDYSLKSLPSVERLEGAAIEEASGVAYRGRSSVRPVVDLTDEVMTIGMTSTYSYQGLLVWSDTQYLLDLNSGRFGQHTFTCRPTDRNRFSLVMRELRTWFLAAAN